MSSFIGMFYTVDLTKNKSKMEIRMNFELFGVPHKNKT